MSSSNRKHHRQSSVVMRLTLRYGLVSALFCTAVFYLVSVRIRTAMIHQVDDLLTDELHECAIIYETQGMSGLVEEFLRETSATAPDELFFRLVSVKGEVLKSSDLTQWAGIEEELVSAAIPNQREYRHVTLFSHDHPLNARLASLNLDGHVVLQLGLSLQHENLSHLRTRQILLATSLAMIGLSTLAGYWVARQAMTGVRRVTRTVQGIHKSNLNRRVPSGTEGREIDELASAFNQMLHRIEALVFELKEVSDNVAHDLRSPITRMRGIAETTLTGAPDLTAYQDMGLIVLEECDRLAEMINTMLEIAQSESGVLVMEESDVEINSLLRNALDLFQPLAEEKNILLLSDLPESEVVLRGDKGRLQRAVANLLDNALKYTPANGSVHLACNTTHQQVEITIGDTGPGILPEELPRLFDRFYRGEKSRSSPGNGLGLSLAKTIIQSHHGDLTVESTPGQGSVFAISLPRPAK